MNAVLMRLMLTTWLAYHYIPMFLWSQQELYPFRDGSKYGYHDSQGHILIAPAFDEALGFKEGIGYVRIGAAWRYIDAEGRFVSEYSVRDLSPSVFCGGRAVFTELCESCMRGRRYGYVDLSGAVIVNAQFDFARPFSEGLAAVQSGREWHFITPDGQRPFDGSFEAVNDFSEGLASVRVRGLWGFIGRDGAMIIAPRFARTGYFREGLAEASENGKKWGFIGRDGSFRVAPEFDRVKPFSEGLAAVKKDFWWGYVDSGGRLAIGPAYAEAGDFRHGLAPVMVEGLYGYIDATGTVRIKAHFYSAGKFSLEGIAWVTTKPPTRPGIGTPHKELGYYIDLKGRRIVPRHTNRQEPQGSGRR